jgi:glycosyltransferase involved in cell wall biosynthesis
MITAPQLLLLNCSILVDNKNGLVVPDGNTEMFANALATLLNDQELALKPGSTARIGAKRTGSWMDVAKNLKASSPG